MTFRLSFLFFERLFYKIKIKENNLNLSDALKFFKLILFN